jgi:PAS domain-containing protein
VRAFTASLHIVATRKVEDGEGKLKKLQEKLDSLKARFAQGCRLLLGVSDVSFWTFATSWEPQKDQHLDPAVKTFAELILENAKRDKVGWQNLSDAFKKRGALAMLPSVRPDCRDAVVVSDAGRPVKILLERQEFLHEILEQFASAYDHSIANLGIEIRLKAREEHLRIATAIVTALGETVRNPREALKAAGQELLKLGYRRIMFTLMDSKHSRIRGISDCLIGEKPTANVAAETDFSLMDPEEDIQPWVVINKKACVVDDWRTWAQRKKIPFINVDLCRRAGTRYAFAVVPMFIRVRSPGGPGDAEEVFGTIHVERGDGLLPSQDDIDDLLEFGRQMAATAYESQRVAALLDALHCDQDSVVLFNEDGIIRFANKAAEVRFGIRSGWHEAHAGTRLGADPSLNLKNAPTKPRTS